MTTTTTPRVGLTQQSDSSVDSPSMAMFNANMSAIETKLLIGITGNTGARPAAGTRDRIYHDSTTHITYYDDGTTWRNVAATPTDATVNNTATGTIPLKVNGISSTSVDLLEVLLNSVVKFAVTSGNGVVANPGGTNYLAKLAATTDHLAGYFLCNDALTAARSALVDVGTSFTGTYGLEARKGATSLFGVKPTGDTDVHGNLAVDSNITANGVTASGTVSAASVSTSGDATVSGNLAMTGTITGTAAPIVPVGGVIMWAGTSLPAGGKWKWCDGSGLAQASWPDLYAAIGDQFGGALDPLNFNLPNLSGTFPRGAVGGAISTTGGASSHTHPLSGNGHALINMSTSFLYQKNNSVSAWTPDTQAPINRAGYSGGGNPTVAPPLDGNTDSASSLPPYLQIGFIIRALP